MVRKKVKKTPARSKKVANKKKDKAECGAMNIDDLMFLVQGMIDDALAPKATPPQQGETTAPDKGCAPAPIGFAGQVSGNESSPSNPAKLLTLPEELQALHERMMSVFMPELQALEKRFGYSDFYRDLSLAYLTRAVRTMAAAVSERDPRSLSGKPLWWDSRDDEAIAKAMHSRLSSEILARRKLAKVRSPESFDAHQLNPFCQATKP